MVIYLDNAASAKVDDAVLQAMDPYQRESYGNASSLHQLGKESRRALIQARHTIAQKIGAKDHEIIFTSGGTESNTLALKGLALRRWKEKGHLIVSSIEHDSVLETAEWLEEQGFSVTYLTVDAEGLVRPEILEKAIRKDTFLVSIMHANNEVGTIQDLESLGKTCKRHNILLHTDACQSFLKVKIPLSSVDLISLNAHKMHGPKGIGALYIKQGVALSPLLHGGGHELGLRSGTQNIPGIVGFAEAVKQFQESDILKMKSLRDLFFSLLEETLPKVKINGSREKRLCNNVHVSLPDAEGESLVMYLDMHGICCSTGSACSSEKLEPSHVLRAMNVKGALLRGSLRFTLSKYTTEEEIRETVRVLSEAIKKLGKK